MNVETALSVFIDETNDEYYLDYTLSAQEKVFDLSDADLVELPLNPAELNQSMIKVWHV